MSGLVYLLVLLLLVLVQLMSWRALPLVKCAGDECSYIRCGAQADPYCPDLFLRVPFMAWLSKQAHYYSGDPEQLMRVATTIASMLTVLVSMLCAHRIGGVQAALIIGIILTLMPGRIILSRHIWPDIWLGLWLSLAFLILIYAAHSPAFSAVLLGLVAAMAFLTRFDALLLAPFAGLAMASHSLWIWVLVIVPTALVFVLLSVRNARRYHIPWPDNTWMFNLMIASGETEQEPVYKIQIEQLVYKTVTDWKVLTSQDRSSASFASLRQLVARPLRACIGSLLRFWSSLGPDNFVLQRLLLPYGEAYSELSRAQGHGLKFVLTAAFPIFTAMTIVALLVAGSVATVILWPTLALATGSLMHCRTRYRQAWLPGAALLLVWALSTPGFWSTLLSWESTLIWLFGIALAIALMTFRVRQDIAVKL